MSFKSQIIGVLQLNPYVRFVNKLEGATCENHKVPWRILYDFELVYVLKGKLGVERVGKEYMIEEGCVHLMQPFTKHRRFIPKGETTEYYSVHFDFLYDEYNTDFSAQEVYQAPCEVNQDEIVVQTELMSRSSYKLEIMDMVESLRIFNQSKFTSLFDNLLEHYRDRSICGTINAKADMMLIISELLKELGDADNKNSRNVDVCSRFIDYTVNHYSEFIDIDEVIRQYGLSPSRFRMIFKAQTDKAPLEYIIDYRINQAKRLFLSGRYNMTEVSYMVGYDDMHYFSRLFKQKTGQTPSQFIKNNKKN